MTQILNSEPTEKKNKHWNLVRLREEAGLTQKEMAEYLNISSAAYNYKENGKREFDGYEIFRISCLLDKSVEQIFLQRNLN